MGGRSHTQRRFAKRGGRPSQARETSAPPPSSSSSDFSGNSDVPASSSKGRNDSRRGRKKNKLVPEFEDPHATAWKEMEAAESHEARFEILKGQIPEGNVDIDEGHLSLIKDFHDVFVSSGAHSVDSGLGKGRWGNVKITVRSSSGGGAGTVHDHYAEFTDAEGNVEVVPANRVRAFIADTGLIHSVNLPLGRLGHFEYTATGLNGKACTSPMLTTVVSAHAGQGPQQIIGSFDDCRSFASPRVVAEALDVQGASGSIDLLAGVEDGYLENGEAPPSTLEEIDAIPSAHLVTIRAAAGKHILEHPLIREVADAVVREGDLVEGSGAQASAMRRERRAAVAEQANIQFIGPRSATLNRYSAYRIHKKCKEYREHAGTAMDPTTLSHTVVKAPATMARVGSSTSTGDLEYNIALDLLGTGFCLDTDRVMA
jgi:hypothetical protein